MTLHQGQGHRHEHEHILFHAYVYRRAEFHRYLLVVLRPVNRQESYQGEKHVLLPQVKF